MTEGEGRDEDESQGEVVRDWLKRSLDEKGAEAPDLLAGVQRRIRVRSRGKFFADGWSTTQTRASHVLIGVITLLLVLLAYGLLAPWNFR
jgi:hypothetical protein